MAEPKTRLWNSFDGKGFAAEYAEYSERASKDVEGNEISKTYATKDAATTSAPGLMSAADKEKLDGIAENAQVNTIQTISANRTPLDISNKNVDIPLATNEVDGLLPHGKFPLIPPAPDSADGPDQVYSFDGTNESMSWQTIVKDYLGNMVLDQQGNPVTGEDGSPVFSEDSIRLWLSYKGTEFGARRAYDDHTGANIHDSIEARTTLAQVTAAIESALANYGGFVVADSLVDGHPNVQDPSERFIYLYKDSSSSAADPYKEWIYTASHTWDVIGETSVDISNFTHKVANAEGNIPALNSSGDLVNSGVAAASLTSKAAADGGTDLSLVTTGEKYVWNNTRQLPDPEGHVNGAVLSIMSNSGTRNVQWDGESGDDFIEFTFPDGVEIGGKLYRAMQIGTQIWLAENLDYKPAGFADNVGTGKPGAAYYPDHTEWGLQYNRAAAYWFRDNAGSLPTGWRVAKESDFTTLFNYIKNEHAPSTTDSNVGQYLKTVSGWPTDNGNDEYGFSAIPSGFYRPSGGYQTGGTTARYMTQTPYKTDSGSATVVYINNSGSINITYDTVWSSGSIRLVKDAPVEE